MMIDLNMRMLAWGLVFALTATSSRAVTIALEQDREAAVADVEFCEAEVNSEHPDSESESDDESGMGSSGLVPQIRSHESTPPSGVRTIGSVRPSAIPFSRIFKPRVSARFVVANFDATKPLGVVVRPFQHGIHAPPCFIS